MPNTVTVLLIYSIKGNNVRVFQVEESLNEMLSGITLKGEMVRNEIKDKRILTLES